jgi:hypothetical protein
MLRYRKIDKRKKAQVGETVTWVVATIVIIGILIIFLVVSSIMSKVKAVHMGDVKIDMKGSNLIKEKTFLAEQLNNQNKEKIESVLNEQNG